MGSHGLPLFLLAFSRNPIAFLDIPGIALNMTCREKIMNTIRRLTTTLTAVLLGLGTLPMIAAADMTGTGMGETTRTIGPTGTPETTGGGGSASRAGMATDPNYPSGVSAVAFIEQATEKNFAIINAAELALDKESDVIDNPGVREFAQQMIKEHKQFNRKLAELANEEQLNVSDSAKLLDQAQRMILRVRDGESFHEAYANNQIADHQELVDLFSRVARSDHGEVSRFAENALPTLEDHLARARAIHPNALVDGR